MTRVETGNLKQDAVLWPNAGYDGNGQPRMGIAVAIKCRWEKDKRESPTNQEGPIGETSTVFVDRVIAIGSTLWEGLLADLPSPPTNLHTVVDYRQVKDIKGRAAQRTVTAQRSGNAS